MRPFQLAMGQMHVEGGDPDRNLRRAEEMIRGAAAQECDLIALPECLDLGWTHPSARDRAEPIPGPRSDALCRAAIESEIHVVAGLTERSGERVFNSAILISPGGEILHLHRKINILEIAQDLYATGDRLGVAETELGTLGIDICADNFTGSLALGHSLARMGAHLILAPSAWAVEADHDNEKNPCRLMWRDSFSELARLYDITVVGVSNVGWIRGGPWDGRKCIGYSLVVGPGGEVLAEGTCGVEAEELITVRVSPIERTVRGTDIEKMLRERGYEGP
jgi:predicted amidohydrolase